MASDAEVAMMMINVNRGRIVPEKLIGQQNTVVGRVERALQPLLRVLEIGMETVKFT